MTNQMDWFEQITGFKELDYASTLRLLRVEDGQLVSQRSMRRVGVGRFETPSLGELRQRLAALPVPPAPSTRLRFSLVEGDVAALHGDPANAGALFQVASQFNALEMVSPNITPEHGVTRYSGDHTQGPACAIAAGAATIYRNYLVPLAGRPGQTHDRQVDCLSDLGEALGNADGSLWTMRNGYALATEDGLRRIAQRLTEADAGETDALAAHLRIGLHWGVEVTAARNGHLVSQAFCSALPVRYSDVPARQWEPFARLVLDAAYEATLIAAVLNGAQTDRPQVYLTRLGGGAFGNDDRWILDSIERSLAKLATHPIDVRLVSHRGTPDGYAGLLQRYESDRDTLDLV